MIKRSRPSSYAFSCAALSSDDAQPEQSNGLSPAASRAAARYPAECGLLRRMFTPSAWVPAMRASAALFTPTMMGIGSMVRRISIWRTTAACRSVSAACSGMPRSWCSRAHGVLGSAPAPMPSITRPPLMRCTVDALAAMTAG